jgi:hypothetical protein
MRNDAEWNWTIDLEQMSIDAFGRRFCLKVNHLHDYLDRVFAHQDVHCLTRRALIWCRDYSTWEL